MTLNDPTAPLDDDLTPVTDPRKDELTSDVPEAPGDEEDTGVPDQGVDDTPDDTDEEEETPTVGALYYNFRLAPEAVWLIVNTVIGTLLVQILADIANVNAVGDLGDIKSWLTGLAFAAVRTAIGAILAAATGGGFQTPGQTKEEDAVS